MQVTSGSLVGTFGPASQKLAESMLRDGLIHFLATDGHSPRSRRPRMLRGFHRAAELVGVETAELLCCRYPAAVAAGQDVPAGPVAKAAPRRRWFGRTRVA